MATTTAKTKKDVDAMSVRDRLYDSLSYTYGKKGERLAREYDKAYSKADRQNLSRGMQRSSLAGQTLANLDKQKIDALDDNESALIADYENRLTQAEQQDAENERWEKQFAEGQRQFNEGMADKERQREWQSSENKLSQQWQSSENALARDAAAKENELGRAFTAEQNKRNQEWQSGENALNRAQQTSEREASQRWQTSENEAQRTWQSGESAAQRNWQTSENRENRSWQSAENLAQRNWQSGENAAQRSWQSGENALDRAHQTSEREATQRWQSGENALNREHTTSERLASQEWQSGENALNRAQSQSQFEANLSYQRERDAQSQQNWEIEQAFREQQAEVQQAQWREQFDYGTKTDDQKIAYNYVAQAAANGGDVSDELLARAGLSRADYNAMKSDVQATSGSSGSRRSGSPGNSDPGSNTTPAGDDDVDAVFDETTTNGSRTRTDLTPEERNLGNYLRTPTATEHLNPGFTNGRQLPAQSETITLDPVRDNPITQGWAAGNRIVIDPVIPAGSLPDIEAEDLSPEEIESLRNQNTGKKSKAKKPTTSAKVK